MIDFFDEQKHLIGSYLKRRLAAGASPGNLVAEASAQVRRELLEFALRGKMIRGGLVRLAYSLFRDDDRAAVTACGAALEIIQSALLVHDDIMDRDALRRGAETLHTRHSRQAREAGLKDPEHLGAALGICIGDIGFFLGMELLGEINEESAPLRRLILLFCRELAEVGAAQMLDMESGAHVSGRRPDRDSILALYRYKTGRYSFSLPLAAGALLAGRESAVQALETIGELLGVMFQIKDDELGLFGDEREVGKSVGSDIREGKNTIFLAELTAAADESERRELAGLWGKADLTAHDIEFVRSLARSRGVFERIATLQESLARQCREEIRKLAAAEQVRPARLEELLAFSLRRRF